MKVLICQLRNYGDIIRTFPLLDSLKAMNPSISIDFTCLESMVSVCKLCGSIDNVIAQPRLKQKKETYNNSRICDISILDSVVSKLRAKSYDLYIDLHGIFQSGLIGILAEIPIRLGRSCHTTKDGAHLFYTEVYEIKTWDINRMERHFHVAKKYFSELKFKTNIYTKWHNKKLIAIVPGSSKTGILKRWGIEYYLELSKKISMNYDVVFILGPDEIELYVFLQKKILNTQYIQIVDDWDMYQAIFENCRYIIGNDSAALHLAIWKGIPTYMICGPTSNIIAGVWRYGIGKTIFKQENCFKCNVWSGNCQYQHKCMDRLTVKEVYDSIIEHQNILEKNFDRV